MTYVSPKDIFYYVYIWIAYNFLDVLTTHVGFLLGFPEGNPIPAAIVDVTSPALLPVYKLSAALLWLGVMLWLARRWERAWLGIRVANVVVFLAVLWNCLLIGPTLFNVVL